MELYRPLNLMNPDIISVLEINQTVAYLPVLRLASHFPPDPREDPKSRSLNGASYKVPLLAFGAPNWGIYFLDPPLRGLGLGEFKV